MRPCDVPVVPAASLFGLHEGLEPRDGTLHGARALDHLRQKHLAGAEQVADDLHAVHQRAFDDRQRPPVFTRASSVSASMKSTTPCTSACASRVFDGRFAPGQIGRAFARRALDLLGKRHHPLRRVRPAVEDDVLDVFEQIGRDVLVDDQLPGIDDAHVEAGLDGVEEKRRVDGLADDIVAAEGERQVADAATDLDARALLLDEPRRLDEVLAVVVVLFEPGRNGEDVGVEDDVRRIDPRLLGQQPIGALADLDLARDRVGLALFVECHDDHRRAEPPNRARLGEEVGFALLEADRVDDRLALHAFEPGLR